MRNDNLFQEGPHSTHTHTEYMSVFHWFNMKAVEQKILWNGLEVPGS